MIYKNYILGKKLSGLDIYICLFLFEGLLLLLLLLLFVCLLFVYCFIRKSLTHSLTDLLIYTVAM